MLHYMIVQNFNIIDELHFYVYIHLCCVLDFSFHLLNVVWKWFSLGSVYLKAERMGDKGSKIIGN